MKSFLGLGALLISALIFSSFGLWIRILNHELSVFQQIVFRNLLGLVLAFVLTLTTKSVVLGSLKRVSKRDLFLYTFSVPLSVIFFNFSVLQTKLAVATFSFYLGSIILGLVLGAAIFKETLTLPKKLSLVFSLAGLASFLYPYSPPAQASLSNFNGGFLWGLSGGLLDGIANVFRKTLGGNVKKILLVFLTMVGGVVVSGSVLALLGENASFIKNVSATAWGVGLIFGLLLVAVNYLLLFGFQNFDLNLGSIVLAAELLFSLALGWFFYKEIPTANETVGGVFIALAVVLSSLSVASATIVTQGEVPKTEGEIEIKGGEDGRD